MDMQVSQYTAGEMGVVMHMVHSHPLVLVCDVP